MNSTRDAGDRRWFAGVRALVVGLGREGTALARFLLERGASVTVTDIRPTDELRELTGTIRSLAGERVSFSLGGHPLSVLNGVDVVFVSPGVPLDIPLLQEAQRRALPLSSETRLFTRLCPAPVVGITGSSGKTTTTALVGAMLDGGPRRVWIGGNIGQPLITHLEEMQSNDIVVMELSSFQLELFAPRQGTALKRDGLLYEPGGWSPHIGALLNVTPNHLDRHGSMQEYTAAKANILLHQRAGDWAVVGFDDPRARLSGEALSGQQRVIWFSLENRRLDGAFLDGESLILQLQGEWQTVCRKGDLKLLGDHNVSNTLAAMAIATAAGASPEALERAATTFSGVKHRLEFVLERDGVGWYNDSIATSPERTMAALKAFDAPILLLAGGRDKDLPWDGMAALTWSKARHLILFGQAAGLIETAMRESPAAAPEACRLHQVDSLARAVELAAKLGQPGDVVLLSPGATSFDMYADFEERGDHFRRLVKALD